MPYFLTSVTPNSSGGVHSLSLEKYMLTAADSSVVNTITLSSNNAAGSAILFIEWDSTAGEPNNASWPNGKYVAVIEGTAAGANVTYGALTLSSGTGHFGRISNSSAHIESTTQANAAFTGTGIKTSSRTWSPSAGSTTDRLEYVISARNVGTMSQNLSVQCGLSSHTFTMPSSGGAAAAGPLRFTLMGAGR